MFKTTKAMTQSTNYITPNLEIIEVYVEAGFALSGVEVPDFENENEI